MATANEVARYLQRQPSFGATHLQKLVYYSQAWALTWTGRPLFDDEIEAWDGGPVVRAVWTMAQHGDTDVEPQQLTSDERAVVDAVYSFYGRRGGKRLSNLTHTESPWIDAYAKRSDRTHSSPVISHASMRRFYTEKALLEPAAVPAAPVVGVEARDERVREAGRRQRNRWRRALDTLAKQ